MSKDEALKLALTALEEINKLSIGGNAVCLPAEIDTAMDAIKEALAQPEQEPVAWMEEMPTQEGETRSVRMTTLKEHATLEWGNPIPLYTTPEPSEDYLQKAYRLANELRSHLSIAPAQRTWVGFTESEIKTSPPYSIARDKGCFHAGVLWAEAKLKEKNNG